MPVQDNIPDSEFLFADRPFPVEEAESFFSRLKQEGKTSLNMVITWKSLEHEGPEIYDEAYLAYLRKILIAAENEGIEVFIRPHQNACEKWQDNAPAWALEKPDIDRCIGAYRHAQRRLKKCTAIKSWGEIEGIINGRL